MKTKILTTLAAICVAGLLVPAFAQTSTDAPGQAGGAGADVAAPETSPPVATPAEAAAIIVQAAAALSEAAGGAVMAPGGEAPAPPPRGVAPRTGASRFSAGAGRSISSPEAMTSAFTPPAEPVGVNTNGLAMNFMGAPLSQVLNYLADAAGFIVVQNVMSPYGTVTIHGNNLTKQECVDLLNAQLNKNELAAVFSPPRTVTVMTKQDAKSADIPVIIGSNPTNVPVNAAMVTQIIPIRFVDAGQLVSDLSVFVSQQATIEPNTAGNSIIITDTQANIHHLLEIIKAIDDSAEMETTVHRYILKFASPVDVANELASLFPSSSGASAPVNVFGGGRGGRGGGGGGRGGGGGAGGIFGQLFGGGGGDTTSDRIRRSQQVNAVPDSRIQAVVVTMPKSLEEQITLLIDQLDVPSERDQNTYVLSVTNADPYQVVQELQSMFNSTTRNNNNNQNGAFNTRKNSSSQNMGTASPSTGLSSTGGGRTAGN
jgi:type II secretory pathway component GspD/PulD (secretin)